MVDSEIKDGVAIIPEGITEVGCGTNPNSCTKLDIINNGYNSNFSSPSNDTGDNEEINAKLSKCPNKLQVFCVFLINYTIKNY
jgi:hypothetical protein